MNLNTLKWDEKMLNDFEINNDWLPQISASSSNDFGTLKQSSLLNSELVGIKVGGMIGD
jgi:glycerol kinase